MSIPETKKLGHEVEYKVDRRWLLYVMLAISGLIHLVIAVNIFNSIVQDQFVWIVSAMVIILYLNIVGKWVLSPVVDRSGLTLTSIAFPSQSSVEFQKKLLTILLTMSYGLFNLSMAGIILMMNIPSDIIGYSISSLLLASVAIFNSILAPLIMRIAHVIMAMDGRRADIFYD